MHLLMPSCSAGVVLLYLGAAILAVRLASESTTMYFERHLIWGGKFDRCLPNLLLCFRLPSKVVQDLSETAACEAQ